MIGFQVCLFDSEDFEDIEKDEGMASSAKLIAVED